MNLLWTRGLLRRRGGRVAAAAAGVAVAVALLACLGSFLAASKATMTARAGRSVAVDWQVAVQTGGDPAAVQQAVRRARGTRAALPVGFAATSGLQATTSGQQGGTGGTTQSTGPGVVLGLPPTYQATFPTAVRTLTGVSSGVLLAQQTAANLHVAPGDTVRIGRAGLLPVTVRVAGVVDLPQADSLFQKVGAPPQSQPQAPPDNVVLLPMAQFRQIFGPLANVRPDLVTTQVHVLRDHHLATDPAIAFAQDAAAARNLEAATTGAGLVGDNLGAALDAARSDALYSQVLFVFLGVPGALLAGLLTAAIAVAGAARRRREQSLLRSRGCTRSRVLGLAVIEAVLVGVAGSLVGLGLAALVGRLAFGSVRFGATTGTAIGWTATAVVIGLLIAVLTLVLPARRELREATVTAGLQSVQRARAPRWARYGVDLLLLAGSVLVFAATSRGGYTLVLAPEGVPTISVSYWAFLGPALLWVGAGLFCWRLADLLLSRGRPLVARALRPLAGNLAPTVAAGLARQRRTIGRSVVLLALAVSFAASTATFNATYRQQAEADAQLTNGADVTVTVPPGTGAGAALAATISGTPGVRSVEPMQHRFAYVGADLQDLYGVRPNTIGHATGLQDAYFQGGTATQVLARLARRPDSVLVSAETVKDFQLRPGDLLNLRLQDVRTHALRTVPFHYAGIVKEFPTAPKDSFFVTNASYVAAVTGDPSVGAFLVDTAGTHQGAVAASLRSRLGTGATVTDIGSTRALVGSSLTAVDLSGLTRVELSFALLLAAAAGGLVLALGLAERRRTFAITTALGATPRQLRGFVVGEAAIVTVTGIVAGAVIGWALSQMLVKVLTGVFDPPPAHLAVPWTYLTAVLLIAVGAIALATRFTALVARRPAVERLREL
jgi:putative ABC transport system permease protein